MKRKSFLMSVLGVGLLALGLVLPAGSEAQFTFTKVVDTNTAIPGAGASGNFTAFSAILSHVNGNVAFKGFGNSSQQGIYTIIGGVLDVVADKNTQVPGGAVNFAVFGDPSFDGTNVAFRGLANVAGPDTEGIYSDVGGTLGPVVKFNDPIPGGGNIGNVGQPSIDNGNVAFWSGRFFIGGANQQ